jgi:tRNA(fMet)-specific endonuclease VapC
VNYLLDTNACIAVINGSPSSVRTKLDEVARSGSQVWVSAVVLFELWYGVFKSSRPEANSAVVEGFLAGPIGILGFDEDDAQAAGAIRAELQSAGKPIGAYDYLIAGQALRNELTLVTANTREFSRVRGLSWEDWAKR